MERGKYIRTEEVKSKMSSSRIKHLKENSKTQKRINQILQDQFADGRKVWNKGITGYTTSRKGMLQSEETKENMKKNHWSKTQPEKFKKHYFECGVNKPTKYELKFANFLDKKGLRYKQQVNIDNKYQVDFLISDHIIIEIDGEWHYPKKDKLSDYDMQRDKYLKDMGYEVIHITNDEVE